MGIPSVPMATTAYRFCRTISRGKNLGRSGRTHQMAWHFWDAEHNCSRNCSYSAILICKNGSARASCVRQWTSVRVWRIQTFHINEWYPTRDWRSVSSIHKRLSGTHGSKFQERCQSWQIGSIYPTQARQISVCVSHSTTCYNRTQSSSTGRNLKSRLDLLKPNIKRVVDGRLLKNEKGTVVSFQNGEMVMVRHYHRGPKWLKGEVLERIGPVLYMVLVDGATWRRHVDQMRRSEGVEYRN